MNGAAKLQGTTATAREMWRLGWLKKLKNAMQSQDEKHLFILLFVAVISLLFFAGCLSWFTVQYQTNDDAGMNMFATGRGLAQQPSEFLLYQHFIIGLALKFLYSYLPTIPWYGVLLYIYLFLSSIVTGYALLRLNNHFSIAGLWAANLVLFYAVAIVSPQFTICAGFLGVAGVLLLYSILAKPHAAKHIDACLLALAAGLIILAGFVRHQSMLLALLLFVPLYIHFLLTHFTRALRLLAPLLCSVVLCSSLLNWGQQLYYKDSPGWELFHNHLSLISDFTARGKVVWNEETRPLFQQTGWSQNDLAMIQNWFYLDPVIYSTQNLSFISQNTPFVPQHKLAWNQIFANLKQSFLSPGGLGTLLLCGLLLIRAAGVTFIFAASALSWYCALFIGISVVEKNLPIRVWLVMLFGLYVMILALWQQAAERQTANKRRLLSRRVSAFLILTIYLVLCLGQFRETITLSLQHRSVQESLRTDLIRLQPRADQLFVIWGAFPYEGFQLPTHAEPVARDMQLLGLGAGNHEPFVQNRLKSFGISDLYQSFYTREDVFLVSHKTQNKFLIQYIQEHYQAAVEIKPVFQGATFTVNKVRKLI